MYEYNSNRRITIYCKSNILVAIFRCWNNQHNGNSYWFRARDATGEIFGIGNCENANRKKMVL